ncbi:MAG: polysaccharide deacetylase family protein [Planctomycetota bacterium]|jgi:peptidoglycan/xylan/chitin deacetylase (PgdA/CDA1 family)
MSFKHQLKQSLREAYARLLYHTGLHAVANALAPKRMTILFGHCIDEPDCNGFLPADMKLRAESFERVVGWFSKRYEVTSIGGGQRLLAERGGRSIVALSFDDGYRDNRTALLPLLEKHGASATVFLESRPLDERRVNWSHKYHWALAERDTAHVVNRYLTLSEDRAALEGLRRAVEEGAGEDRLRYQAKRVMKYDAEPEDRDRTIQTIFEELGGDERALCEALYMSWDDVRALRDGGVELGGHTVNHVILSRLDEEGAEQEIGRCRESMERELGPGQAETFAYPFGRRWDYDQSSIAAARKVGFVRAVNTHAGTNTSLAEGFELRRLPVDDTTPMHLLVAEACGGFELLRRFGLDLSE